MVSALPESMRRSIVKGRLAGKRGGDSFDARLRNGCSLNLIAGRANTFRKDLIFFPLSATEQFFYLFLYGCEKGSIVTIVKRC